MCDTVSRDEHVQYDFLVSKVSWCKLLPHNSQVEVWGLSPTLGMAEGDHMSLSAKRGCVSEGVTTVLVVRASLDVE